MIKFPKDFMWGGASSGPQSEGRFNKKHANVFDHWYETEPEEFHDFVGPNTASNFYHDYRSDIARLEKLGFNSLRTSIQWTRLIDDFEEGTLNEEGVTFYHNVIDTLIEHNIEPLICLYHFDLPIEIYNKYGGWESYRTVELFTEFARRCFELYGDKVDKWFVFNEPKVSAEGQYLHKYHYPKIYDPKKYFQASYHYVLATAKVIKEFRTFGFPDRKTIGTILNLTPAYPASQSEEDLEAARNADLLNSKIYLDPAIHGEFPEDLISMLKKDRVIWQSTEKDLRIIKENTIDFLGVNYYHPERVQAPELTPTLADDWYPNRYFKNYQLPGRTMNVDKGWEVYPEGIYDIALIIKNEYSNIPWYVSENGMGTSREHRFLNKDGIIEDDYRIEFIQEHLKNVYRGIEEGSDCKGYHMWTPIDNWSWKNAYKNRYGFVSVDINTQKRVNKKSAQWFKQVAESNSLGNSVD